MIKFAAAIAASVLAANAASAAVITVTPTLAPNAFGSPSYAAWVNNSIAAQKAGATSAGTPGTPTYYQAQSNVTASENIVTGFASWKGVASPGGAFANELGNRMLFGVKIDGAGQQFSISGLSFAATSSYAGDPLAFGFGQGSYNYSADYVGVLKGDDGILFTADDILITSGPNTQLVDGLIGRGSGSSFAAYCDGCTAAQQQAAIDAVAAATTRPETFTGTYSLFIDANTRITTGSGTFNISTAVPEPATWAMMMLGFGAMGAVLRRRQTKVAVRYA